MKKVLCIALFSFISRMVLSQETKKDVILTKIDTVTHEMLKLSFMSPNGSIDYFFTPSSDFYEIEGKYELIFNKKKKELKKIHGHLSIAAQIRKTSDPIAVTTPSK